MRSANVRATGGQRWAEGGAHEVLDGVYRIPLPLPNDSLRAVNVYAIVVGDGTVVMIDGGLSIDVARDRLTAGLAQIGFSLTDIRRFLVTHVHRDHYTQAISIRRAFGSSVELGYGERASLENRAAGQHPLAPQLRQLRACGAAPLAEEVCKLTDPDAPRSPDWEFPDQWLHGGVVTLGNGRELAVIETPGHTQGHVVFHDAERQVLFAGDHVLPTITPSIGFEGVLSPDPLGNYLGSLARVRQLPDARLLPAHGPVAPSVHARVDELVAHHGRRLEETERALTNADTAFEAAKHLLWTKRNRPFADLDAFNQMLAVIETRFHLALLAAQGRVIEVTDAGGVTHFSISRWA